MKKLVVIILFFISQTFFMGAIANQNTILYETEDFKITNENNELALDENGKLTIIESPFASSQSAIYGTSPNNKYFAYSKHQAFTVFFYDIKGKEKFLLAESDSSQHGAYYFMEVRWLPGNDDKFFIIRSNDSIGNISFCYYENLKQKYCIEKIQGVSDNRSDDFFYIMPDDYDSFEINESNELIFKKSFGENSYEIWKTNLKGENSVKTEEYINGIRNADYFKDTSKGDPFYPLVQKAKEQGWISGYPDGTIRLEDSVNRAEFAKMIMLAFEKGKGDGVNLKKFPDVYSDQWYIPYLSKAVEWGSMKGYPDGTMRPGDSINRAEALKMTLELLSRTYKPIDENEPWYEKYRVFAISKFSGLDFLSEDDMSGEMTRGECIQLILEAQNHVVPG